MRETPLSMQEHTRGMRRRYPDLNLTRKGDRVIWEGCITPAGKRYRIRISCRVGPVPSGVTTMVTRPEVEILRPAPIRRPEAPNELIPHLEYAERPGERWLCLFDASNGEWHHGIPIADMVPWVSEWLLCYEIWHAIGEWTCG